MVPLPHWCSAGGPLPRMACPPSPGARPGPAHRQGRSLRLPQLPHTGAPLPTELLSKHRGRTLRSSAHPALDQAQEHQPSRGREWGGSRAHPLAAGELHNQLFQPESAPVSSQECRPSREGEGPLPARPGALSLGDGTGDYQAAGGACCSPRHLTEPPALQSSL